MPRSRNRLNPRLWLYACGLLLALSFLLRAAAPQHVSIFVRQRSYAVSIVEIDGNQYVDLSEAALALGVPSIHADARRFRLRVNGGEADFRNGESSGKVNRNLFDLGAPFLLQQGRGLVPFKSLPELLGRLANERADFHPLSRRIFLGNSEVRFTTEIKQPGLLQLNFSAAVNPQISVEGNQLQLKFSHDGIVSGTPAWKFSDSVVESMNYQETSDGPELVISSTQPLLARFNEGGKAISISAAPRAASAAPANATTASQNAPTSAAPANTALAATAAPSPTTAPVAASAAAPSASTTASAALRGRFLIVIDAAHGGSERGAALSSDLAEKDVTLAIAERLSAELQSRGVPAFMIRAGDVALSSDQRAVAANAARGALYLSIHAGTSGHGLRIFTSMLAPTSNTADFLPWDSAQAAFVISSRQIGGALLDAIDKQSSGFSATLIPAPVRPLNNIAGTALAVEISPPGDDPHSLADPKYQQQVAVALADAIATVKPESSRPAPPPRQQTQQPAPTGAQP